MIKLFVNAMAEACIEGSSHHKESGDVSPEAAMRKAAAAPLPQDMGMDDDADKDGDDE